MSEMDNGAPSLEVGFEINTGSSADQLIRLDDLIDRGTANALSEFAKIEKASAGMLNLGNATASMRTFGSAATKETQSAARELANVEKAGERLSNQLGRQNTEFGKTREQLRGMKVETAALAAEQQGLTELAGRLRAQEAELYAQEFALARRFRLEAEAAAEEKTIAAQRAVAAAEKEAQALREAAHAYDLFESAARKGALALREVEAAQAVLARENEAQRLRSAAFGYDQFESAARRGAQAMREQEAAAERDAAALARLRAMIDPAAAAHARLNVELAEARRVMTAAGASAEDLARAESMLADRAAINVQNHNAMAGAARKNSSALQNIALQLPDITQGLLTGQKPMTVFIQ
jgi:chromosome segregation ATPase